MTYSMFSPKRKAHISSKSFSKSVPSLEGVGLYLRHVAAYLHALHLTFVTDNIHKETSLRLPDFTLQAEQPPAVGPNSAQGTDSHHSPPTEQDFEMMDNLLLDMPDPFDIGDSLP
jgi:hypothetical protein